jgi:NAD(P)-dependent dehydrogenase (short-subunit alcohol dehydrogenase family)
LVVGGHGPLRQAVSSRLDQAGAHAVLARASAVTAGPLAERAPDGVVLLTGLDPARAAESGRALYHELLALVGALEALPEKRRLQLIVATTGARGVLDEPVTDPESVLAFGPVLALPAESEWLTIRLVDVPATTPEGQASLLVREARATAPAADVAWRGGRRWLRQFTPIEPEAGELPLRQGGVYLITGGLGGIGLALAAWLARSSPSARLLLTGRKALPRNVDPDDPACEPWAREAARAIREIEGVGGDVLTVAGDVADAAAMRAAIALATARWGPLNGVIHAAGNPGSGKLTLLQDDADVAATLSPKVAGLAVLTELLRGAELDFVALMSSINAVLPAPGVGAYAAANVALDSFAESGPHPKGWRRVVAIDWSAWAQVGMAANLIVPGARRASHDALLRTAIPTDVGVDLFGRILASGRNRVVVTSFDLQAALDAGAKSRPEADHVAPAGDAVRPELSSRQDLSSRYDPPRGTAELAVAEIWTELIGIPDIGAHDDFFELGGHSLLATRVLSRISQIRGVQLTLREFFDAPTIRGLSEKIEAASNHAKPLVTAGPHADAEEREEFLL